MRQTILTGALLMTCAGALSAQRPLVVTAQNLNAASRGGGSQTVLPGDVLRYQLRFTNQNQGDVRGVVFTNPVPAGLRYIDGSAGTESTRTTLTAFSVPVLVSVTVYVRLAPGLDGPAGFTDFTTVTLGRMTVTTSLPVSLVVGLATGRAVTTSVSIDPAVTSPTE